MLSAGVLPHLDGLSLEALTVEASAITITAASTNIAADCPHCGRTSDRTHSHYVRTLHDLPIGPHAVTVRVRVRRFRCRNRACPRMIFCERLPNLGGVRARRTYAQQAALRQIGLALGGAAGARLAERMGLPASPSTILRLVQAVADNLREAPRVLGVDDWAWRKGQRYGTILVDLERRRPIDLLPERSVESFAAWLRAHPGVEVIARDRGSTYADGARQGAPGAVHVADRYHLLCNVGDALERVLARKHACLKEAALACGEIPVVCAKRSESSPTLAVTATTRGPTRSEEEKQDRRARRLRLYETIVGLRQEGHSLDAIARRAGVSLKTVRRFLRAEGFPERAPYPQRPTSLSPFEDYLRGRLAAGSQNAKVLWEEIRALGFRGSAVTVRRYVGPRRLARGQRGRTARWSRTGVARLQHVSQPVRALSPRQARWLLLRPVTVLRPEELAYREQLLRQDEAIGEAQALADDFTQLVRERDPAALAPWLVRAGHSALGEFREFVVALRRDLSAVEAALTYEWSSGQTEGQINRLKMLKRQMYGRASLPLLKRRFLEAA